MVSESTDVFERIELWPRLSTVAPLEKIVNNHYTEQEKLLIRFCYEESGMHYEAYKPRKNKEPAFIHPLNVARYLVMADADAATVCVGFWHDILEEERDLEEKRDKICRAEGSETTETEISDTEVLSRLNLALEQKLKLRIEQLGLPYSAKSMMESVMALTRHKKHRYFKSISDIFSHPNYDVRERAIQVKLADRLHNIQTIDIYPEEGKIYECFKNLFILNNVKKYLMDRKCLNSEQFEKPVEDRRHLSVMEKLFEKCGKATYDSLFQLSQSLLQQHPALMEKKMAVYLQLALELYNHKLGGLWQVTESHLDDGEHPASLYDGIIQRYDAWFHHSMNEFNLMFRHEVRYCRETLSPLQIDDETLRLSIDYKDAIALKEILGLLLYKSDYFIQGFGCSQLCRRERMCES